MRGALEDVADMEDLDNRTKAWRNEVSELYYDTEDCIDDFRHRVEGGPSQGGQGFIRRAGRLLETLMARYQISRKIKKLRTRAQEANDRRTRYKPDECVSRSARVYVDPRITALYAETSSLVGIDAPKEEVVKLLTEVGITVRCYFQFVLINLRVYLPTCLFIISRGRSMVRC